MRLTPAVLSLALALAFAGGVASGCGGSSEKAQPAANTAPSTTVQPNAPAAPAPSGTGETFTLKNWAVLATDPDSHKGAQVNIVGKIFVAPERDAKGTYFQMWASPKNSDWNTIVGYSDPQLNVSEDDYVRVRGTVKGSYDGENALGGKVAAALVVANSVQKVDATAAATPARRVLRRASFAQASINVVVRKIEMAPDETRVFVAVRNGSQYGFNPYTYSMKLVADGRQLDQDTNFDYPQVGDDLVPGAYTQGVVTFPPISPSVRRVDLYLEGSSEDTNVGEYGSLKWHFYWR